MVVNFESRPYLQYKNIIKNLDTYDKNISDRIHSMEIEPLKEKFVYLSARLFNPDFVAFYFVVILLSNYFIYNDLKFILKPLLHTLILLLITLVLKKLTARPRPSPKKDVKRLYDLRQYEKNCSMPSGDSLQSANWAIILFCYFNSWLGFLLIPFVMFARIYYFCHYVFDTIVGSAMGLTFSYLIYLCIN
jgi:membrane-associated phospholipid phosphatase